MFKNSIIASLNSKEKKQIFIVVIALANHQGKNLNFIFF